MNQKKIPFVRTAMSVWTSLPYLASILNFLILDFVTQFKRWQVLSSSPMISFIVVDTTICSELKANCTFFVKIIGMANLRSEQFCESAAQWRWWLKRFSRVQAPTLTRLTTLTWGLRITTPRECRSILYRTPRRFQSNVNDRDVIDDDVNS